MVKHIILWQLKDELSAAEKAEIKANIKTGLEWMELRTVLSCSFLNSKMQVS